MKCTCTFQKSMLSDENTATIQSASILTGWVLRTFRSRDIVTMKTLYKSLILSKLDYCSPLINIESCSLLYKYEQIQRSFTRKIEGMSALSYWERLKVLKLYSLQRRQERFKIIYLFKIMQNFVPNPGISITENERTGYKHNVSARTARGIQEELRRLYYPAW